MLNYKKTHNNRYLLLYPNNETKEVMRRFFVELLKPNYEFSTLVEISDLFYSWITTKNTEEIINWLNLFVYKMFDNTSYEWISRNPEWWLKSIIWLWLVTNSLWYFWEIQNIKWRRDMVLINKNTIYVLEVKVNWTVKEALEQIEQKYTPQLPID